MIILSFNATLIFSQGQSFLCEKENSTIIMRDRDNDDFKIMVTEYIKTGEGVKERAININGDVYSLKIETTGAGKVKTIMDAKDSVLATIFLEGTNANNILLKDGTLLQFKKSGASWFYMRHEQQLIKGTYENDYGDKIVTIERLAGNEIPPVVEVVCLERGIEKGVGKVRTLTLGRGFILTCVAVAIPLLWKD